MLIATAHLSTRRMTGAQFRSFQETRADHERWELVKGIPIMMLPPTISHQRIADNLKEAENYFLVGSEASEFLALAANLVAPILQGGAR